MKPQRIKVRGFRLVGRDDQWVMAVLLTLFLLVMAGYFWHRSVVNSGLIEFESMPQRNLVYLVDINSAPWPELANLPGIGEKLSREIVRHRDEYGPFEFEEQLLDVRGIGELKLQAIRPHLAEINSKTDAQRARTKQRGQEPNW